MDKKYQIHPRIGTARLGNSPDEFYLAPEKIGGLPIACDDSGNVIESKDPKTGGTTCLVDQFKDPVGRIKRQAAKFRILEVDDTGSKELTLGNGIKEITWTVHIANKKPVWYTFSELQGNLEFGEGNSYENQHIQKNNPDVIDPSERKKLMIDPGPRSISKPGEVVEFSRYNPPADYPNFSFPPRAAGGTQIDSLGELRMDDSGNLIALGGFGNVSGTAEIDSFRGASGYWDDISDGYVLATVHLDSGESIDADPAWLLVGSPKYAPELVNITTLYDTMWDVAVRKMNAAPDMFPKKSPPPDSFPRHHISGEKGKGYTPLCGFNPDYQVSYEADIKPIIDRIQSYRWVADIPYLADFANPGFDLSDPGEANRDNRIGYFENFRVPVLPEDYDEWIKIENGPEQLFSGDGIPLMPLNSGDNSVTNMGPVYKFETLSVTQYFCLYQWAQGKFKSGRSDVSRDLMEELDEAGAGNCVGAPFSPGIETTWIVRNWHIYEAPFQLKLAHFTGSNKYLEAYYRENGLDPNTDEAEPQSGGCEPGALTKRMAIPWQSDFQECTVQTPNITVPNINQFADGTGIEVPPAYYVYWWPPQSPMHVVTGSVDPGDQVLDGVVSGIAGQSLIPAGQRVPYQRGILTPQDMIDNWSRLGFIVNQSANENYPYLVEKERNFQAFGQIAAATHAAKVQTAKGK